MRLFDLCVAKKLSGGGGGDNQFTELVQRTITTASDSDATSIGAFAFHKCTNLTSVDFPNVSSIGYNAFSSCANLTSVDFPNVSIIGESAFYNCTNLISVDFPNVSSISRTAFYGCTNLTSVDFPNVTSIDTNAFYGCTKLSTIVLHKRAILASTGSIPSQTIVYVENADLEWYSTASNWSAIYADGRVKSIDELPE